MKTNQMFGLVMSCLIAIMAAGCGADSSATLIHRHDGMTNANEDSVSQLVRKPSDVPHLIVPSLQANIPKNPSDEEEYATDLLLYANCKPGAWQIAIPQGQANGSGCNQIMITAARNANGDFYEVGASFDWGVAYPSQVVLSDPWNMKHGVATVMTTTDLFSNIKQEEPMTSVVGCMKNQCAVPPQPDCVDMLCMMVEVTSVINIEGEWSLEGMMINPGTALQLVQSGRDVSDLSSLISHGHVSNASLDFTIGDYGYHGVLAQNHVHLSGSVKELLTDTVIGSWSASRNP